MFFHKAKRQSFLKTVFHDPSSKWFVLANDFFVAITFISVAAIVLETVPALVEYEFTFQMIEYVTAGLFTLEYLGRLFAAEKKGNYVFSFFGIVDLLAILPTFLGLANFTFLKTARTLRIMRFLRMLRLAKISRPRRLLQDIEHGASVYKLNIQIYFASLFITVLIFGTFIYFFESPRPEFNSIPNGMFWALQVLLSDNTATPPSTNAGATLLLMVRFSSLILLGLLISVVGNLVRKALFGSDTIE